MSSIKELELQAKLAKAQLLVAKKEAAVVKLEEKVASTDETLEGLRQKAAAASERVTAAEAGREKLVAALNEADDELQEAQGKVGVLLSEVG